MNAKVLWVLFLLISAYSVWSFFVASRYQALCQLSYWSSTAAQLQACDDKKRELQE